MSQDKEHLRLLSIFHYVVAGLTAFFSLWPACYVAMGLAFIFVPMQSSGKVPPPPAALGWIFVTIGCVLMAFIWALAVFIFLTGRFLAKQKHYTFCLVIAAIECLCMPFGTILGVFTIIVLMRESVKQFFSSGQIVSQV